jgi:hypothetical protein
LNTRIGKIVFQFAGILLLLVLIGFVYLEYRQVQSYRIPVHRQAQTVVKLNIDQLVIAYLKESGFLFGKDTAAPAQTRKEGNLFNTGLEITANVFVYNTASKSYKTIFCTLPVSSPELFKQYASQQWQLRFSRKGGYDEATGMDGQLTVFCTNQLAAISFSPEREEVRNILEDLVTLKNILSPSGALLSKLKQERGPITIFDSAATINLKPDNNRLLIHGNTLLLQNSQLAEKPAHRVFGDSSYAYFYLNGTIIKQFAKEYAIKNHTLHTDSLLHYFGQYADIELRGVTSQKDTVTTYEFDDNFEKKEITTVAETSVPLFRASIRTQQPGLLQYLSRQGLSKESNQLNREIFPLYAASLLEHQNLLSVYSGPDGDSTGRFIVCREYFSVYANFSKLKTISDFNVVTSRLPAIGEVKLNGIPAIKGTMEITGSVIFEKPVFAAVKEIIDGLY